MQPSLERITHPPQTSLAWRYFEGEGWDFTWHFHPEIELTLITAGHGQRFVGDSIETFGPGDLVLLGPNLPHTWHSPASEAPAAEPAVGSVVIQFDQDFAGAELWRQPEAGDVRQLLERARRGLHFSAYHPRYPRVTELMRSMHDQTGWERVVTLLQMLGELATPVGKNHNANAKDPESTDASHHEINAVRPLSGLAHALPPRRDDQQRIDVVCRLIAERYATALDQAEVAGAIHLSPSSFSRFFKRMTGRTFVAYAHELRIADACRRLAEGPQSITDICFDCGFENVSNFNRVFRRLRGVSPREYRRSLGSN